MQREMLVSSHTCLNQLHDCMTHVSNKIFGCFYYCILCVSAQCKRKWRSPLIPLQINRLNNMIPSQLLDNEVFLGCKRRVASCSLSPVFKHPPNQQGREASATRKNARVLKAMPQGFTKPLTTGFIGDAISTTISACLSNARRLLVSSHTSPNQPHDCMALP